MDQNPRHAVLGSIIYGPVKSRRLGWSLGVNVLPAHKKLCNFDCVYCQLGWSDQKSKNLKTDFPNQDQVIHELQNWFINNTAPSLDCLTLSGNGEPTLNPHFPEIANALALFLKIHSPTTKLVLLTNGTQIHNKRILQDLKVFSEVCVKHDPNYKIANRPQKAYASALDNIFYLKPLPDLVLQSCIFVGEMENLSQAYQQEWWGPIIILQPKRLDLYTIDTATTPTKISAVSTIEMQKLKKFLVAKNICVRIF